MINLNKKIVMFFIIIFMCISAILFYNFDKKEKNFRYQQHIEESKIEYVNDESDNIKTHLPILSIKVDEENIPGEVLLDSNGNKLMETLDSQGNKMTLGEIEVYDNDEINTIENKADFKSSVLLRYRGNSSIYFSKKGYLLKLVDEEGNNVDEKMLAMAKDNEWVLNGPFLDKTLMRNYMAYNLAGMIMGYAPNVRFCELYLNDEYQGLYILCESISRSKNRVNISKYDPRINEFGYIVCLDDNEEDIKNISTFSEYSYITESGSGLKIIYPSRSMINDEVKAYIESDFSEFERALYSYDFNDPKKGYKNYINVDSFVNYYIFQEFMEINDTGYRSTYLYKEKGGKIVMGPVWDYNNSLNNYFTELDSEKIQCADRVWYSQLLKDKDFVDRVVNRYKELRKTILNEEYLLNYIDSVREYLGEAINRNFDVWGFSFDSSKLSAKEKLYPESRNIVSYDEAIKQLKDEIVKRGRWLDDNIDTLYQYCQDSKNRDLLD